MLHCIFYMIDLCKLLLVELIRPVNELDGAHYIVLLKYSGRHFPQNPCFLGLVLIKWDEYKL